MRVETLDTRIHTFYRQLAREGILPEDGGNVSVRIGRHILFAEGPPASPVTEKVSATEELPKHMPAWKRLHHSLYSGRKDVCVILLSMLPCTRTAATAGKEIPPLLDDFAQLVGVTARVMSAMAVQETLDAKKLLRSLKHRNAVLIKDSGGLCVADSMDDALAVAQVLEKNCRAVVSTAFLGGGHRINRIESWLMRLVYKYKYSKLDPDK